NCAPSFGNGFLATRAMSTGLVHGTASLASATSSVLLVPSTKSAMRVLLPNVGQGVLGPVKTCQKVECGCLVFTPMGAKILGILASSFLLCALSHASPSLNCL